MALGTIEQITYYLHTTHHILIAFRKDSKGDSILSAAGLALFLEKQGKKVDIVCEEFSLPSVYSFVPKTKDIQASLPTVQKMVLTLDISSTGVSDISYTTKGEKLHIYITPQSAAIPTESVQAHTAPFSYDLIITLNTQDLESLGTLYSNYTDLFHKTPIINIDHDSSNEHFGHMNHTDITASSTAEVVFHLTHGIGEEYIDETIATALLAGMIANTRSFKTANVRPHTLQTASTLMQMGADRDLIITHLYQKRSLNVLRLWGEALSNLAYVEHIGLAYTVITRNNFIASGATEQDLEEIIDELITNSPEAKIILILHEFVDPKKQYSVCGIVRTQRPFDAKLLTNTFSPKGNTEQTIFYLQTPIQEAVPLVVDTIKKVSSVILNGM